MSAGTLGNPLVRQAIAHALNRSAIVRGAFYGQATPIVGGVIPEWNWGYAGLEVFKPEGDIEKAKALLAEAGVAPGTSISLTMVSSWPPMMSMAPIIQANLSQIGFTAEIDTMEVPRYWDEVWGPSKFDLTVMYWLSPLADPDDFVTNTYATTSAVNVQKGRVEGNGRPDAGGQVRRHHRGTQGALPAAAGAVARDHGT